MDRALLHRRKPLDQSLPRSPQDWKTGFGEFLPFMTFHRKGLTAFVYSTPSLQVARSRPAQTWSLPQVCWYVVGAPVGWQIWTPSFEQSCPAVGLQTRSPSNPEFEERVGGTAAVAIPPCLASRWNWLCNDKAGRYQPSRKSKVHVALTPSPCLVYWLGHPTDDVNPSGQYLEVIGKHANSPLIFFARRWSGNPLLRLIAASWATVNITTSHRQHARLAQAVDQDIRFGGTRKARWFGEQGWSVTRLGTGRGARYGSLGRSGNCRRSGRRWSMGRHMRGGVDQ